MFLNNKIIIIKIFCSIYTRSVVFYYFVFFFQPRFIEVVVIYIGILNYIISAMTFEFNFVLKSEYN